MENAKPEKSQTKLPKKKIFQIVLKNFAAVGIEPNLVVQPYPINGRILMGFCILGSYMICNFKHTFVAKTFVEYTQTAYMGSAAFVLFFVIWILLLNVKKMFKLINDAESIANLSVYTVQCINITIYVQFY